MSHFSKENLVFQLPHATVENYFNAEVVVFLLILITLVAGLLICFFGYKYFNTFAFLLLGIATGFIAIHILKDYIANPVMLMFFFVMFVFLAECLFYGIYSLFIKAIRDYRHGKVHRFFLRVGKLHRALSKRFKTNTPIKDIISYSSPFFGALLASGMIYGFIYRDLMVCVFIVVILAVLGFIYQKRRRLFHQEFYTYDDIYYGR